MFVRKPQPSLNPPHIWKIVSSVYITMTNMP